jgi:transposase
MISMPQIQTIRQLRRSGESIAAISRMTGISRDTVYKYLREEDLSPRMPVRGKRGSMMDAYRPTIEQWLDDDSRAWRKQRHTAKRIYERLRDELGCPASESTVRHYVAEVKRERGRSDAGFLDLVWHPGEAQADFGEADFYVRGVRTRLLFFVLSFPYSNVGFAQVLPSQNAECVCQGLKSIFEHVGGVPGRIVFDNATGVGRRACGSVRTTELFGAFAAHYGFAHSFCNPNAGHEKGNVEGKVGSVRRNLLVPPPQVTGLDAYNGRLLGRCAALSDKPHWLKGARELDLFAEDRLALAGLPERPFNVVRYERHRADKYGKVRLDGRHLYSAAPELAGRELIAALGATTVEIYDAGGTPVCSHERAYGDAPTDSTRPANQLALLCTRPGGWRNSRVREQLPDALRDHMDGLGGQDLKAELRIMRDEAAASGWDAAVAAMELALASVGRIDAASVAVAAARGGSPGIEYDEPVDLSAYDRACGLGGR